MRKSFSSKYLFLTLLLNKNIKMNTWNIMASSYHSNVNSCCAYPDLVQGDFYSFDQKKDPFLSIYLLPTHKKYVTTTKIMLTSI